MDLFADIDATRESMGFIHTFSSRRIARTAAILASLMYSVWAENLCAQFVADSDAVGESGEGAVAVGPASIAVGPQASATGDASTAVGYGAVASGVFTSAIGRSTVASSERGTALGIGATASGGPDNTAIGAAAMATGLHSTAVGVDSVASGEDTSALGKFSEATGYRSTALGAESTAIGNNSTATGSFATASGAFSTAIGNQAEASASGSTALGRGAQATALDATAIGEESTALGIDSIAIGSEARADFNFSTAIGADAATTRPQQIMLGDATKTYTAPGITSTASSALQTGPTRFVTTDMQGNLAAADFASLGLASAEQLERNTEGVSMAMALSGVPDILPEGANFAISFNGGIFEDETAIAVGGAARLVDNVFLNSGGAVSTSSGIGGGRAGMTFVW